MTALLSGGRLYVGAGGRVSVAAPGSPPLSLDDQTNMEGELSTFDVTGAEWTITNPRYFATGLPLGLGLMEREGRILGVCRVPGVHSIVVYAVDPTDSTSFESATFDWTINAHDNAGNSGSPISVANQTEWNALSDSGNLFASDYSGAGAVVELAASISIDTSASWFNKLQGHTSPIIIRSADPDNRATLTGGLAMSAEAGVTCGNIFFDRVDFHKDQSGTVYTPADGFLPTGSVFDILGTGSSENIAFYDAHITSDLASAASTKGEIKEEMFSISPQRPHTGLAIVGCDFSALANAVNIQGVNIYMADCIAHDCWGDLIKIQGTDNNPTTEYVLTENNVCWNMNGDGLIRHPNGVQGGGSGSGTLIIQRWEDRGSLFVSGSLGVQMLPAIVSPFWNTNKVVASTNQGPSTTDDVLYRMETDVAGGGLTVTLPDITTVATNWECCVQKFSSDTSHTVTVVRDAGDGSTINGVSSDYSISGKWQAVRFFKASASNWGIQLYGPGMEHWLIQGDGGLTKYGTGVYVHHGIGIGALFSGFATEDVDFDDLLVEHMSLMIERPGDTNSDGVNDHADGYPVAGSNYPTLSFQHAGGSTTLRKSIGGAGAIRTATGVTTADLDESQTEASQATTEAIFRGGYGAHVTLDAARSAMRLKPGYANADYGAMGYGLAAQEWDWSTGRARLPMAPMCSAALALSGGTEVGQEVDLSSAGTWSGSPALAYFVVNAGSESPITLPYTIQSGDTDIREKATNSHGTGFVDRPISEAA